MESIPVSKARENLFGLIDQAIESHRPLKISSRRGSVVLIAEEDWEAIQETLYLNSIPGVAESILEAASSPDKEFISLKELDGQLGNPD